MLANSDLPPPRYRLRFAAGSRHGSYTQKARELAAVPQRPAVRPWERPFPPCLPSSVLGAGREASVSSEGEAGFLTDGPVLST